VNATHLIEANTRQHTQDGYTSWHMVAAAHESTIRGLVAQLDELNGTHAKPQPGCHFREVSLGELTVQIEYETEGGEAQTWDHPGCEASVSILQVFLNGCWVDPQDFVADSVIERWEQEILEALADEAEDYDDLERDDCRDDVWEAA
jgi:hypothetical protein